MQMHKYTQSLQKKKLDIPLSTTESRKPCPLFLEHRNRLDAFSAVCSRCLHRREACGALSLYCPLQRSTGEHLSPSGSGGNTVGLGTRGLGTIGVTFEGSGGLDQMRVGKRSLAHSSEALSAAGRLAVALVGGEVERDEEDEVRADDTDTSESSKLLSGASARIGHPGPVGRCEVGVRGKVNEA